MTVCIVVLYRTHEKHMYNDKMNHSCLKVSNFDYKMSFHCLYTHIPLKC